MADISKIEIEDLKNKIIKLEKEIAKKDEQLLEYQKKINEYDYILDQIETSIYWKDKEGKLLGCNDYVVKISGKRSKNEIIGKNDSNIDFAWSKEAVDIQANDKEVMQGRKTLKFDESFVTANYGLRIYISKKSPLINAQNKVYGVVGIGLDITERIEMENKIEQQNKELNKKDEIKTEFIENFSHDVKVPINALVGRTQLLKLIGQKEKNEKFIEVATDTENSAMVLDTLFKQMRNIIIHEQFDNKIYSTNFNLSNLIEKEIEIAKASIPTNKKIDIHFVAPENLSIDINSDHYKLSQIVRNLLSNAIKYTDEGNIDLETEVIKKNYDQITFKFTVSDTGIGIDEAFQDNIFELFNRANITSHNNNRHGMGIGLYIVKNNINLLGGNINFESYVGQGSRFSIEIPLHKVT